MQATDLSIVETVIMSLNNHQGSSFEDDYDSNRDEEFSDIDIEMPPDFPVNYTVGDLSSHIAKVKILNLIVDADVPDGSHLNASVSKPTTVIRTTRSRSDCLDSGNAKVDSENMGFKSHSFPDDHWIFLTNKVKISLPHVLPIMPVLPVSSAVCHVLNEAEDIEHESGDNLDERSNNCNDPEYCSDQSPSSDGIEFGDFATFSLPEPPPTQQPSSIKNVISEDFDDDFSNFETCGGHNVESPPPEPRKVSVVKNLIVHIQTALEAAFSLDPKTHLKTFPTTQALNLSDFALFKSELKNLWSLSPYDSVQRTWNNLTSQSSARYAWDSSAAYSMYLQAVGVDLQHNRFLTPGFTGRIQLLEPTLIAKHPATPTSTASPKSETNAHPSSITPAPTFNWSTSNLVNPLESDSVTSRGLSEFDFEIFEGMPSKSAPKPPPISELESEFLSPVKGVTQLPPPPPILPLPLPCSSQLNQLNPKTDSLSETELPNCVCEALARLPDFSYLRQTVLAFPILEETCISNSEN